MFCNHCSTNQLQDAFNERERTRSIKICKTCDAARRQKTNPNRRTFTNLKTGEKWRGNPDSCPWSSEECRVSRPEANTEPTSVLQLRLPLDVHPTTEIQDEHSALKQEIKAKDAEVLSMQAQLDAAVTDRQLYAVRDLEHVYGRYKLGETTNLNDRKITGTQTMQPDADVHLVHTRVFNCATKADIKAQEELAFARLKERGCPRVPHKKTLNDSEFVDNATAHIVTMVIDGLADAWNRRVQHDNADRRLGSQQPTAGAD